MVDEIYGLSYVGWELEGLFLGLDLKGNRSLIMVREGCYWLFVRKINEFIVKN